MSLIAIKMFSQLHLTSCVLLRLIQLRQERYSCCKTHSHYSVWWYLSVFITSFLWSGFIWTVLYMWRFVLHSQGTQTVTICGFFSVTQKESRIWFNNIFVPSAHLLSVENSGGRTEISNKFCIEFLVLTVFHIYLIYRIILMTVREGSFRLWKKKYYCKKSQRKCEGC